MHEKNMKLNSQQIKHWITKSEKKINYTKLSKLKKISIKIIMVKIKIKNKLEDNYKFFIGGLNWKEK